MSEIGGCLRCIFTFFLTLGLSALFLWLTLRTSNPSSSIKTFYLPSLNRSLNSPTNTTIFMNLRLKNNNKEKGVFYDPVNITVHCFQDPDRSHLWQGQIHGFYQGFQKTATKNVTVETPGVNWTDAVAKNEAVVFRVDLSTQVRFKIMGVKTKRHRLMVGANVTVGDLGAKNTKKSINLKSGGPKLGGCCRKVGIFIGVLAPALLSS